MVDLFTSSVSPLVDADLEGTGEGGGVVEDEGVPGLWDPDTDDEDVPAEFQGEIAERVGLEKEGKFIRKLIDPKLPTKEEVDMHNLMGHVEDRKWCEVCVVGRSVDIP